MFSQLPVCLDQAIIIIIIKWKSVLYFLIIKLVLYGFSLVDNPFEVFFQIAIFIFGETKKKEEIHNISIWLIP